MSNLSVCQSERSLAGERERAGQEEGHLKVIMNVLALKCIQENAALIPSILLMKDFSRKALNKFEAQQIKA